MPGDPIGLSQEGNAMNDFGERVASEFESTLRLIKGRIDEAQRETDERSAAVRLFQKQVEASMEKAAQKSGGYLFFQSEAGANKRGVVCELRWRNAPYPGAKNLFVWLDAVIPNVRVQFGGEQPGFPEGQWQDVPHQQLTLEYIENKIIEVIGSLRATA